MGILDGPARKASATLIRKFGKKVTVVHPEHGQYDTSTGTSSAPPPDEDQVSMILGEYKARFKESEQRDVRIGDLKGTVAASELSRAPDSRTKVEIGGRSHEVVHINPVYSGDEVAIYELHLRR